MPIFSLDHRLTAFSVQLSPQHPFFPLIGQLIFMEWAMLV
jgi:hypothetical protein